MFGQFPAGNLGGHENPILSIAAMLAVEMVVIEGAQVPGSKRGWITDVNQLCCDLIGWEPGRYGDERDPDCKAQTLVGKPLDVLIPPPFRGAHTFFAMAFQAHPIPRTMGEGRNTPIWIRKPGIVIDGIDSIEGRAAPVLIGLAAMDENHTCAIVQAMHIGRSFTLPGAEGAEGEGHMLGQLIAQPDPQPGGQRHDDPPQPDAK